MFSQQPIWALHQVNNLLLVYPALKSRAAGTQKNKNLIDLF
jgi:hypothetical protein